jgi:glycosyltransferase involved in cell wall biosynthesis
VRCPTLNELPDPPSGKTGWPWTEQSPQLPDIMLDGASWPRVSIVTPSYNQAQFIEETIRSVLLQGYPDLEYIIMDGSSTDGSVELIRKYEPWLAYWVSEPDRGQGHAINKGFSHSTGKIFAWLNSDDIYETEALGAGINWLTAHPEPAMVYGDCFILDKDGQKLKLVPWIEDFDLQRLIHYHDFIPQPASFVRAEAFQAVGGIDEDLYNCLDYDLWIKIGQRFPIERMPGVLAAMRIYPNIKTIRAVGRLWQENSALVDKYGNGVVPRQRRGFYHLDHARFAWRHDDGRQALWHLLCALWYNPSLLNSRWIHSLLPRYLAGPWLVAVLREIKHRWYRV